MKNARKSWPTFMPGINVEIPRERHERVVEETRLAQRAIDRGVCPNDYVTTINGVCPSIGCMFKMIVAPPVVVDSRPPFHQKWWKRVGSVGAL